MEREWNHDILFIRTTVLQGGWPLFYIEWRWCWWTRIILISKTSWLLVCSFWHCLRSFWRFVSNFLHRKTTPKLWPSTGWDFLIFSYKVNPLWAVVLYICIIALLFKAFKNIFICKYKKTPGGPCSGHSPKAFSFLFSLR